MSKSWEYLGPGFRPRERAVLAEMQNRIITPAGDVWYADVTNGASGNSGKSWAQAKETIQACVNLAGDGTGDVIYVAPGTYPENVLIVGHSSLAIIGAGNGVKDVAVRASTATTKRPFSPLAPFTACTGVCFAVLDHDVTIANLMCDASGAYAGIYNGDGYRIDTGYDEDSGNNIFENITFKYGSLGVIFDGCADGQIVRDSYFYKQSEVGVVVQPGGTRTSKRVRIVGNHFAGPEDYGVYLYNAATTENVWVIGNYFCDQLPGTTAMTYSCLFQGAGGHFFLNNFDATNIGALGSATDLMAGNFEKHGMNSPVYAAET